MQHVLQFIIVSVFAAVYIFFTNPYVEDLSSIANLIFPVYNQYRSVKEFVQNYK